MSAERDATSGGRDDGAPRPMPGAAWGSPVSLITTVKNSEGAIGPFLDSVRAQTRRPDEVVVVDGGSTDGTLDALRLAADITLVEAPGANIARGRNLAIATARHDVIAVSDADCLLEPRWLERILEPLADGADVSMGVYEAVAESFLQRCMAAVNLPDPEEVQESTFLPSARSVAFRRRAIESVGGYPEWLDIGEDMLVDLRWRRLGLDMRLARGARVRWRLRRGVAATWRQYFRYARGDAVARMHTSRHALRFGVYGGLAAAFVSSRPWPKAFAAVGGAAYASRPVRRAWRRTTGARERIPASIVVPAIMAFLDAAKMAGYAAGIVRTGRRPPTK
jgi:glycosyltransferase involved in cell wall biosynthesis